MEKKSFWQKKGSGTPQTTTEKCTHTFLEKSEEEERSLVRAREGHRKRVRESNGELRKESKRIIMSL